MEKRQIKINDELTTYYITDEGKLYNQKTNRWYRGMIQGGYLKYDLRWKNKKYTCFAHRLVLENFNPVENMNNLVVNHINGIKLDNRLNNLEWLTVKENNEHAYAIGLKQKTNGVSERIQYDQDLSNEVWKMYKDTVFAISNKGRAKNCKTNNILKGKVNLTGYVEWCFSINGKKSSKLAHRVVYETFCGEILDDFVINHKDGNKTNNQLDNLEMISASENVMHAYYVTKVNSKVKRVLQYSLDGKLLNTYESCHEAARENPGCLPNLIVNVCNGKKHSHHGYIWKYE